MLLHRDTEEGLPGEVASLAASWLRSEAFESLVELNAQCLQLLAEQALTREGQGNLLLRQVADIWRALDSSARRRAAACPYLLVDVGFSDSSRWRWADGRHVNDGAPANYASFFTVPRAPGVARQVFIYAWHLARTQNAAARLLLGMPAHCTNLIGACTLPQIHELAERHPEWLKPRWPSRVKVWRELLLAAASGEGVALERARMHGLQLLAADSRAASMLLPGGSPVP
jgi:hypothetical protein